MFMLLKCFKCLGFYVLFFYMGISGTKPVANSKVIVLLLSDCELSNRTFLGFLNGSQIYKIWIYSKGFAFCTSFNVENIMWAIWPKDMGHKWQKS